MPANRLARLEMVERALRHWDPIGVIDHPQAHEPASGEYDSYTRSVLALIESGASVRDLARRLASLRVDSMQLGERQPTERETDLAAQLADWRARDYATPPDFAFSRYSRCS